MLCNPLQDHKGHAFGGFASSAWHITDRRSGKAAPSFGRRVCFEVLRNRGELRIPFQAPLSHCSDLPSTPGPLRRCAAVGLCEASYAEASGITGTAVPCLDSLAFHHQLRAQRQRCFGCSRRSCASRLLFCCLHRKTRALSSWL